MLPLAPEPRYQPLSPRWKLSALVSRSGLYTTPWLKSSVISPVVLIPGCARAAKSGTTHAGETRVMGAAPALKASGERCNAFAAVVMLTSAGAQVKHV